MIYVFFHIIFGLYNTFLSRYKYEVRSSKTLFNAEDRVKFEHFLQCSFLLLFLCLPRLLPFPSDEGAGLGVVGCITALAGDAAAHTGLEQPPCLSAFN